MPNMLLPRLIGRGNLFSPELIRAFEDIPRAAFVSDDLALFAEEDIMLPIGFGQLMSDPAAAALLLELLEVEPRDTVLDAGSGSGWTAALLGALVGEQGRVTTVERVPELSRLTRQNVNKFGLVGAGIVECVCAHAFADRNEEQATFDRILVTGTCSRIPESLKQKLAFGGRMVVPVEDRLVTIERKDAERYEERDFPGAAYPPFVEEISPY